MSDTITVIGNITEPELRTTPSGVPFVKFRLASAHRRFDATSNKWVTHDTSWYAVSAFRALGENAAASLHKGERVIVTGRLRVREWDTGAKQGVTAEIEADAVGHDLQWGTTAFARKSGSRETPEAGGETTSAEWATTPLGSKASWDAGDEGSLAEASGPPAQAGQAAELEAVPF